MNKKIIITILLALAAVAAQAQEPFSAQIRQLSEDGLLTIHRRWAFRI